MQHALHLARRALGRAAPNPAVGCVLVRDGYVVGRGWTQPGGRPHAEIDALTEAGRAARGSCAYVTLEPCAHWGESGPCADALVKAGVARVVYAAPDRDARVQGRGAARLKAAGVAVRVGVERAAAEHLQRGFFLRLSGERPLFTAKLATSRAGASVSRTRWITGEAARRCGHGLRAEHDAILVGRRTLEHDRPQLTCRLPGMEAASPRPIVLDTQLRLSSRLGFWRHKRPQRALVCHGPDASPARRRAFMRLGVELISCPLAQAGPLEKTGGLEVRALARALAAQGLTRVLLEGGAQTLRSFLAAGLVDDVAWFRSLQGKGVLAPMRRVFPSPRGTSWQMTRTLALGEDEGRFYTKAARTR